MSPFAIIVGAMLVGCICFFYVLSWLLFLAVFLLWGWLAFACCRFVGHQRGRVIHQCKALVWICQEDILVLLLSDYSVVCSLALWLCLFDLEEGVGGE